MKVLSVKQPWAFLIVAGLKDVENRTWFTNYQGPLLIHASKVEDCAAMKYFYRAMPDVYRLLCKEKQSIANMLCKGAIIGQVELVDCTDPTCLHASRWAEPELWHWNLRDARRFEKTIPAQGKQGLWNFEKN